MKNICFILFFVFLLIGCKESEKEQLTRLVAQWQNKEILFPDSILFTRYVKDTTDYRIPASDYKVLIYVDSIGCTSCKLKLDKWKEFMQEVNSVTDNKVPFLFFFHPSDYNEIQYLLKRERFDHPVCMDRKDELNTLNQFPSHMNFQTFLLDKNNRVILLGNPLYNLALKELYIKRITNDSL